MVALRCKHCGAPLENVDTDAPFVTCEYCGTSQQRVDAKAYMDDLMVQVKSWLSSAMPMGFGAMGSQNVDPVARHSIFVSDVQPKLENELSSYKFNNMALLGNSLLAVPFDTVSAFQPEHTTNDAFEFTAKAKSAEPLAVTDEDRKLVMEASTVSKVYALGINIIKLLGEQKDGRWGMMCNNFNSSVEAMKGMPSYDVVRERFTALSHVTDGFDKFMNGDMTSASGLVSQGMQELEAVKNKAFADPQFAVMFMGIDQEVNICKIVMNIMDVVQTMGGDPAKMVLIVRDVMNAKPANSPKWSFLLSNTARYNEIFASISEALKAKTDGQIPVSMGDGDILMPFWEVDLRYTFTTGKLWSKKSVEVKEDILVCADFALDQNCLDDPSSSLTDIFRVRPQSSTLESWKGEEVSISAGQGIGRLQDSVGMSGANGRRIILPLTTKKEAEKMCVEYLAQRARSDSKLRLSEPVVQRIMYVPCRVENGNITLPKEFGSLIPAHIARMSQNTIFII